MPTRDPKTTADQIKRVEAANTDNFVELVRISGLDPTKSFRFMNLSKVDFSGCNLDGFDFSEAGLEGAVFIGAKLKGAKLNFYQMCLPGVAYASDFSQMVNERPEAGYGDVNGVNKTGVTALWIASRNGNASIVSWLLKHRSIDVNFRSENGETALCVAAKYSKCEVVRILVSHPGIELGVEDHEGRTALRHALFNGNLSVVEILMQRSFRRKSKKVRDVAVFLLSEVYTGFSKRVPLEFDDVSDDMVEHYQKEITIHLQLMMYLSEYFGSKLTLESTPTNDGRVVFACKMRDKLIRSRHPIVHLRNERFIILAPIIKGMEDIWIGSDSLGVSILN